MWAELTAVRSTKTVWFLGVGSMMVSALSVAANLYGLRNSGGNLGDAAARLQLLQAMGSAAPFTLILGVIGGTSVYRHGAIVPRLLYVPVRWKTLLARAISHGILGFAFALLSVATVAVGLAMVASTDSSFVADPIKFGQVALGSLLVGTTYAVLGVAFGDIVRNQLAAVTLALLWVLIVEGPILAMAHGIGQFLPGGLQMTLLQGSQASGLHPTMAGAMLVSYCTLISLLAARLTSRDLK